LTHNDRMFTGFTNTDTRDHTESLPGHHQEMMYHLAEVENDAPEMYTQSHSEESSGDEEAISIKDINVQKVLMVTRLLCKAQSIYQKATGSSTGGQRAGKFSRHQSQQSLGGPPKTTSSKQEIRDKRGRDSDSESEKSGGRNPKQQKSGRNPSHQQPRKSLACPFFKHDALQHNSPPCCGPDGWPNVARLKYVLPK
jgi:hypothetical protein